MEEPPEREKLGFWERRLGRVDLKPLGVFSNSKIGLEAKFIILR